MYFSLITPVPGREREAAHAWARSAGPYVEHQWLWRFFPAEAGSPRDFLFRRRDADGLPRFYVVSQRPPVPAADAWLIHPRDYAPVLEIEMCIRDRTWKICSPACAAYCRSWSRQWMARLWTSWR